MGESFEETFRTLYHSQNWTENNCLSNLKLAFKTDTLLKNSYNAWKGNEKKTDEIKRRLKNIIANTVSVETVPAIPEPQPTIMEPSVDRIFPVAPASPQHEVADSRNQHREETPDKTVRARRRLDPDDDDVVVPLKQTTQIKRTHDVPKPVVVKKQRTSEVEPISLSALEMYLSAPAGLEQIIPQGTNLRPFTSSEELERQLAAIM